MKRELQETSLLAYRKPQNKATRRSNKSLIRDFFAKHPQKSYTIRQVSRLVGLTYSATQKRISDLKSEGCIQLVGKREEAGNYCGTYQLISGQQALFESRPKSRFELLKEALQDIADSNTYQRALQIFERRWEDQKNGQPA